MLTNYSLSILRIPWVFLSTSSNDLQPLSSTLLSLLRMACSVSSLSLLKVSKLSDLVSSPDRQCTDLYPFLRQDIAHPQPAGM
jgi:hypothetical protein